MKYQAYPEYKDSGIEWLGDVPPHWVTLPLKRVCSLATGLTPPTSNEAHYIDYDSGRPWIRPDDLNEEGVVTRASKFLSQSGWGLMKIVPKGSTLICCIGTIGKAGYIDVDVSTNQQITSASFRQNPRYYYYLVRAAKKVFEETATGNVIRILNSERLGGVPFLSVPIDEAKKIADFLDHETAKIDNLIEKQQQLITLLKEKRQAVISHAVTKGLNPDAPMRDSGVEWLGEVPEHWEVKNLRYLGSCQNGINIGADYFGSGYPFVSYGDVYKNEVLPESGSGLVQSTKQDRKAYSVIAGDVMFTRTSETIDEIGFSSVCLKTISNATFAGFLIRFRPKINTLNSGFSRYYFRNLLLRAFFIKEMNLVTRASLSQDLLKKLPVSLPPFDEQAKIAAFLDKKTENFEKLTKNAESVIELLQERRTALISAAVTGKIDVRNWQAPTPTANQPDDKAVAA